MVFDNKVTWNKDYKYDGFLYYIQRVTEMLDYDSEELFRVHLINTTALIDEYISICNGYVKENHLDEVYQEFVYTFNKDIVIQHKWGERKKQQILDLLKNKKERKETMLFLRHTLKQKYLKWCKEYLSDILFQSRQGNRIERAIACFIPELFRYGYSREGIYHKTKNLISVKTDFEKAFSDYLNTFDGQEKEYTVYLGISDELKEYQEILKARLGISFEVDDLPKIFKKHTGFQIIKREKINAVDVSVAAKIGYIRVNLFISLYSFLGNNSEYLISNKVFVVSENEHRVVNINRNRFYTINNYDRSKIKELSVFILDRLVQTAKNSIIDLNRIISYHNNAISNNGLENGFLNLWSILEMICVNDKNRSKNEQVKETIVPILKLDYFSVFFEEITTDIINALEESMLNNYLEKITNCTNKKSQIVNLLLNPNYSDVFDSFIDEFVNYPVLRIRMLTLHDNTKKKSDLCIYLSDYEKRVSWLIDRFYRIRNAIVHSGKDIDDIDEYGLLLHEFVDQVTMEIIIKLASGNLSTIKNVLIDTRLKYADYMQKLNDTNDIDNETVELLTSSTREWIEE